jgi:hypothetical protein
LEAFNAHLIVLKSLASVLNLHGQVSDSISLCQRILSLFQLNKHLTEEGLNAPAKKAWPSLQSMEIVFGVLHYLDRGILPARIHLQCERNMNQKNFSELFAPLEIAKLVPSGHLPRSSFFRERIEPKQAYYTIKENVYSMLSSGKWPAYLNSKSTKASGKVHHPLLNNLSWNYYERQVHREQFTDECHPRPGNRPEDVHHNIELIKSRLGGLYWHLLSVLTLGDLSGQEDLDDFLGGLRGLGISLDFLSAASS